MSKWELVQEFWDFLKVRKRYWLAPFVLLIILLSFLFAFAQNSAVTPFIYTLF